MAQAIIGVDFGNYNSFTCYISEIDQETRAGGIVHDLLPYGANDGIPSVYFYSKNIGTLCGEDAVRSRAKPVKNQTRYLKRHLGETFVLDGKKISYNTAITELIQHCVRNANKQLDAGFRITTNLIALAYPATYTFAQLQCLISLAEQATLEDGRKVKVAGTIAEPAAAALDYLSEFVKTKDNATVLVYDLGGGTFDLGLVSAYPAGRKNKIGETYYYDIINTRGLPKLGGNEFNEIMFELLKKKFKHTLNPAQIEQLRSEAEKAKIDLSSDTITSVGLLFDDFEYVEVTRDEFETAARPLVMQTVSETVQIIRDHPNQMPEYILLTGGASQMPMIKRELETALPAFKGKIAFFRPSRAIAYGAARYGNKEAPVQKRTMHDIGVYFLDSSKQNKGYVRTYIPAGTSLPFTSAWVPSFVAFEGQTVSEFTVHEAKAENPDAYRPDDFTEIMRVNIDHGGPQHQGVKNETRLLLDKLEMLTIEARCVEKPGSPLLKNTVKLQNLS